MEVSNNVSLPSEIVGYVGRVVARWWARFNDYGTPDIGSGGLIPDMRDDLIDVVQFEPMCGGLDDDTIREFAGLLDSSSFDRVHVLERARHDGAMLAVDGDSLAQVRGVQMVRCDYLLVHQSHPPPTNCQQSESASISMIRNSGNFSRVSLFTRVSACSRVV